MEYRREYKTTGEVYSNGIRENRIYTCTCTCTCVHVHVAEQLLNETKSLIELILIPSRFAAFCLHVKNRQHRDR